MRRTHEPGQFVQNPTRRQRATTDLFRKHFELYKGDILSQAPECRERDIAITHLEDACSRAIQAVMYHRADEEPDE